MVTEFTVQSESAAHIEEALQVLQTWNSYWKPSFFMTDFSEAEITALEASFPGTTVYLCDFHREQAWERWTKDRKHGLSTLDAEWLLVQHRSCAWAPSAAVDEQVPADHHFRQAIEVLQCSNLWKTNENVRQWITIEYMVEHVRGEEYKIEISTLLIWCFYYGPGHTEIPCTMLQLKPTI